MAPTGQRSNVFPWFRWWFTAYALVLAANADRLSDSIWIIVPRNVSLLTASAWNPFLANWLVSAGSGEDVTFEVEFAARTGSRVIIMDLTPRAVAHMEAVKSRLDQGPEMIVNTLGGWFECV